MGIFDFVQAIASLMDKDSITIEIQDDRLGDVLAGLREHGIDYKRPQCRGDMSYIDVPAHKEAKVRKIVEGKK